MRFYRTVSEQRAAAKGYRGSSWYCTIRRGTEQWGEGSTFRVALRKGVQSIVCLILPRSVRDSSIIQSIVYSILA